jgi:hypothetical protein
MYIMHHCDNPSCVNVGHLFVGTAADNHADMESKGRGKLPPSYTGSKHPRAKINENDVIVIRDLYSSGKSMASLGRMFGIAAPTVWHIVQRNTWKHV